MKCFAPILAAVLSLTYFSAAFAADPIRPDPTLTPGAINPAVTQANIHSTICKPGWTKTIRPPASYTDVLKIQQLKARHYEDQNPKDFEEDHLESLEIGGSPTSPLNLWPEPYAGQWGARKKDVVERVLNRLVCSGTISLSAAQNAIRNDWISAYQHYVLGQK